MTPRLQSSTLSAWFGGGGGVLLLSEPLPRAAHAFEVVLECPEEPEHGGGSGGGVGGGDDAERKWRKYRYPNGCVYEGELQGDRWHGRGTLWLTSGDMYKGQFVQGMRHGYGVYTYGDGTVYKGSWIAGKKEGRGVILHVNGEMYTGDWRDGRPHGRGRYQFLNGDVYVGEFKVGVQDGAGAYSSKEGTVFIGQFVQGIKHGLGKLADGRGNIVDGRWENGMLVEGVYNAANGRRLQQTYDEQGRAKTTVELPKLDDETRAAEAAAMREAIDKTLNDTSLTPESVEAGAAAMAGLSSPDRGSIARRLEITSEHPAPAADAASPRAAAAQGDGLSPGVTPRGLVRQPTSPQGAPSDGLTVMGAEREKEGETRTVLHEQLALAKKQVVSLMRELTAISRERDNFRDELEATRRASVRVGAPGAPDAAELRAARQEVRELQAELEAAGAAKRTLDDAVKKLEQQLRAEQQRTFEKLKETQQVVQQLREAQTELRSLREMNAQLQLQIMEAEPPSLFDEPERSSPPPTRPQRAGDDGSGARRGAGARSGARYE